MRNTCVLQQLLFCASVLVFQTPVVVIAREAGIDVSSYQMSNNWSSIHAAGKDFAWAKATEGQTVNDSTFTANTPDCLTTARVRDCNSKPTITSTGSSDREATALAVMPAGPPDPTLVITVTPVAKLPTVERNSLLPKPVTVRVPARRRRACRADRG